MNCRATARSRLARVVAERPASPPGRDHLRRHADEPADTLRRRGFDLVDLVACGAGRFLDAFQHPLIELLLGREASLRAHDRPPILSGGSWQQHGQSTIAPVIGCRIISSPCQAQ